jgi:hypothetical protein
VALAYAVGFENRRLDFVPGGWDGEAVVAAVILLFCTLTTVSFGATTPLDANKVSFGTTTLNKVSFGTTTPHDDANKVSFGTTTPNKVSFGTTTPHDANKGKP